MFRGATQRGTVLRLKALVLFGACAAYVACAESTGPVEEHADLLADPPIQILRQAAEAPLETYEASFRACQDESQTLRIRYRSTSAEYVRLQVPKGALWRWPDGRRFAAGDCVRISVTADASRLLVEFHPAGLVFNPEQPVRLRMYYTTADPDLNGDGVVNERDKEYELAIWRLPHGGEPWQRIEAQHNQSGSWFDAKLESFSHYAVAH